MYITKVGFMNVFHLWMRIITKTIDKIMIDLQRIMDEIKANTNLIGTKGVLALQSVFHIPEKMFPSNKQNGMSTISRVTMTFSSGTT